MEKSDPVKEKEKENSIEDLEGENDEVYNFGQAGAGAGGDDEGDEENQAPVVQEDSSGFNSSAAYKSGVPMLQDQHNSSQVLQVEDMPEGQTVGGQPQQRQHFARPSHELEPPTQEVFDRDRLSPEIDDGEMTNFGYYGYEPRSNRYIDSIESKQKISGCLFGLLGTIVLAFGIFLMRRGITSRRSEEIIDYVKFVDDWTRIYQPEFAALEIKIKGASEQTALERVAGKKTSAADVRYALGREALPQSRKKPHYGYRSGINEDDFEQPAGSNRMLEAKVKYEDMDEDDLTIEYIPYKFEKAWTPTAAEAFFESATSTEPRKYQGRIPLEVTGPDGTSALLSQPVQLISESETFSKNGNACVRRKGFQKRINRCLYYHLVSKMCVLVDQVPLTEEMRAARDAKAAAEKAAAKAEEATAADLVKDTNATRLLAIDEKAWAVVGSCGVEHKRDLADSSQFRQEIDFYGYPMSVEVRSAKDPHVRFGYETRGRFVLDESPGGQIAAGLILLFFAVLMCGMSGYKTYRFCVKYTLKDYYRKKRERRYLEQNYPAERQ